MKRTLITGALVAALAALLTPLGCGAEEADEQETMQEPNFPEDAGFRTDGSPTADGDIIVNTFPERPDAGATPDAGTDEPGDVAP